MTDRSNLEILAVIPARGGSKGLSAKNLRLVGGESLVARAASAALASRRVTRVVGSTDDAEIASELRRAGAEVPWLRPASISLDDTPDAPVFLHALEALATEGYQPDIIVNVRPTAPLRTADDIDDAIKALLADDEAQSVKSICEVGQHPYKMWLLDGGRMEALMPAWRDVYDGNPDVARQQLPAVYVSNGAVDAVWCDALLDTGRFHPGRVAPFMMDATRSIDIDDITDLERAETALRQHQS